MMGIRRFIFGLICLCAGLLSAIWASSFLDEFQDAATEVFNPIFFVADLLVFLFFFFVGFVLAMLFFTFTHWLTSAFYEEEDLTNEKERKHG